MCGWNAGQRRTKDGILQTPHPDGVHRCDHEMRSELPGAQPCDHESPGLDVFGRDVAGARRPPDLTRLGRN